MYNTKFVNCVISTIALAAMLWPLILILYTYIIHVHVCILSKLIVFVCTSCSNITLFKHGFSRENVGSFTLNLPFTCIPIN